MKYDIVLLREHPELTGRASEWFSSKWNIPKEEYDKSIAECIKNNDAVPQWYLVFDDGGNIAAGLGVIENDFHKRPDLAPNICAVFVEPDYRRRGIARFMLDFVCRDMASFGLKSIYLITDHTDFYEKCGFEYFCPIEENSGEFSRMYRRILHN